VLKIGDQRKLTPIETDLKDLIARFTQLQKDRNEADYNVATIWSHTDGGSHARSRGRGVHEVAEDS